MKSENGFSLVEVLIAAAILGIVGLGVTQMILSQSKQTKYVSQKLEAADLKQIMIASISDSATCTCQLDKNVNTAQAADLYLDTTATPIPEINLRKFRSGCDLASTNNILASENTVLTNSQANMKVSSVKIKNINQVSAPDTYTGTLTVEFDQASVLTVIKPVEVGVRFIIDTATGSASSRRIKSCASSLIAAASLKIYVGTATVGFFNGNPESQRTTVSFPDPSCTNPRVFAFGLSDSILCGTGAGPTTCPSATSTSQDMNARVESIDTTTKTFKVFYSAQDGVWVGGTSPAYPINWMLTCD